MNSKTKKNNHIKVGKSQQQDLDSESSISKTHDITDKNKKIEQLCDQNLTTLQKIHAILLNCVNLSKKQKLEFCESERYFMKLYLRKLQQKNKDH